MKLSRATASDARLQYGRTLQNVRETMEQQNMTCTQYHMSTIIDSAHGRYYPIQIIYMMELLSYGYAI